jgi:hypothetical protein
MSNKPKHIPRYDIYAATFKRQERDDWRAARAPKPTKQAFGSFKVMQAAFERAGVTREAICYPK